MLAGRGGQGKKISPGLSRGARLKRFLGWFPHPGLCLGTAAAGGIGPAPGCPSAAVLVCFCLFIRFFWWCVVEKAFYQEFALARFSRPWRAWAGACTNF